MSDTLLAIVGTRQCLRPVNAAITAFMESLDREIIIVTGDASGVDAHVKRECKRLGFRLIVCHARWDHAGKRAGPERNTVVARLANRAVAWPASDPEHRELSAGTWNCIDQFLARGKDVREEGWR